MRTASALTALSQSGARYQPDRPLAKALLLAKVNVSEDSCYKNPKDGVLSFPVVPNTKNATQTCAIYQFCFTKFMREMLRSVCKKGYKMY